MKILLKCVLETTVGEKKLKMAQDQVHYCGFRLAGFRLHIIGSADRLLVYRTLICIRNQCGLRVKRCVESVVRQLRKEQNRNS
jgi:hypothetical protein